jgi:hypothetical protein
VFFVALNNYTCRLKYIPSVVDPSAQVRLLPATTPSGSLVVDVSGVSSASLLLCTRGKVAFVPAGVVLKQVALTAKAFRVIDRPRAFQVEMNHNFGYLRIRHVGFCFDYVNHLLGDAFETRRLLGGAALVSLYVRVFRYEDCSHIFNVVAGAWSFLLGLEKVREYLLRGTKVGQLTRQLVGGLHLAHIYYGVRPLGGHLRGLWVRTPTLMSCRV